MRQPSQRALDWAEDQFGAADLGDRRRTRRLVHSAACILEHPAGSLPAKFQDPDDLDAFYRLANCDAVTHAEIVRCAAQATWRRMRAHDGPVLLIHDDTVLDYSGLKSIDGLGQVGNGNGRGLYAHNTLAVTATGCVLGLAWQLLHRRRKVPKGETKAQRAQAPDRESRLWKKAVAALPAPGASPLWVDIADRGADVTEFLAYEHRAGRHYVVRSQHNRTCVMSQPDGTPLKTKLHTFIRQQPDQASQVRTKDIRMANGTTRTARLALTWVNLALVPPRQARGEHDRTPLPVWAIRVWEVNPPSGAPGIEWILVTNVPVSTEGDAWERVDWYIRRWKIEEWHKGMKTGCEIENVQFTRRSSLDVVIGILSVVAVYLLEMRDAARDEAKRAQPATAVVPELWVRVLSGWRGQVRTDWTYGEFVQALARLGGHQNRKHDDPPGWLVLWRGWSQLQAMIAGALAVASG